MFGLLRQRQPRVKDAAYLRFIRTLPCVICGAQAEAAHLKFSSAKYGKLHPGIGTRPDDKWCLPLCPEHHRLGSASQHATGDEEGWWAAHGIDPCALAIAIYDARSDRHRAMEIIATWC